MYENVKELCLRFCILDTKLCLFPSVCPGYLRTLLRGFRQLLLTAHHSPAALTTPVTRNPVLLLSYYRALCFQLISLPFLFDEFQINLHCVSPLRNPV